MGNNNSKPKSESTIKKGDYKIDGNKENKTQSDQILELIKKPDNLKEVEFDGKKLISLISKVINIKETEEKFNLITEYNDKFEDLLNQEGSDSESDSKEKLEEQEIKEIIKNNNIKKEIKLIKQMLETNSNDKENLIIGLSKEKPQNNENESVCLNFILKKVKNQKPIKISTLDSVVLSNPSFSCFDFADSLEKQFFDDCKGISSNKKVIITNCNHVDREENREANLFQVDLNEELIKQILNYGVNYIKINLKYSEKLDHHFSIFAIEDKIYLIQAFQYKEVKIIKSLSIDEFVKQYLNLGSDKWTSAYLNLFDVKIENIDNNSTIKLEHATWFLISKRTYAKDFFQQCLVA
jgi:hypothetical protein